MKKYLTAREAYVDFLTGELSESPLDSKGRLLQQYDGNDYSGNPNNWLDHEDEEEDEEIFDPDYHEDYFDVDEVDEYGDIDEDYDSYRDRDSWDDESDEEDEDTWGEE